MAIARDLLALLVAAMAAFLMFLFASGGLLTAKPFTAYVMTGLWYVWPSLLIVSAVLAPILIFLRRRGRLTLWTAVGLYAAYPVLVSVPLLGADSLKGVGVYLASGLAAGLAYWAVAVLPSNNTFERDARKSGARP